MDLVLNARQKAGQERLVTYCPHRLCPQRSRRQLYYDTLRKVSLLYHPLSPPMMMFGVFQDVLAIMKRGMLLRLLVCMLMSFEHVLKLNYELVLALKVLVSAQM